MDPMAKKVCLHAKSGEFSKALRILKEVKLVKESALNVIIAASNASYHSPEKCELDVIVQLLNTLVGCLGTLEENHVTVYLQSIFHIIKLLCKKERLEYLTKMEAVIIPTFLKSIVLKNLQQAEHTYIALIKQISQAITGLAEAKDTRFNSHLLEIFKIILKAQTRVGNLKDLLTLAQTCLYQIHHLEANDVMLTSYNMLLEILSSSYDDGTEYTDSVQTVLVAIFSNILTDLVHSRNFENASMLLDIIENRVKSKSKPQKYLDSHLMFKAVTALFPANIGNMPEAVDTAKSILNKLKTDGNKKLFYNIVCSLDDPLLQLLLYYRNSDGLQTWNQLPQTAILHIMNFLKDEIICHSMLCSKKCSCGCSTVKNYHGALKIGCQVAGLLKFYVDQSNKDLSKEFFVQLTKWLYLFYGIIKKLKERSCQKWRSFYSDLACHTYNISVVLYRSENVAHKAIDLCFLKHSLELEGTRPEIRSVQTNTFVFSALCEIEVKNQNWSDAMALAALHCFLYIQNSNSVFQNWWIRSKMKVKEDQDFQQQTLLDVLSKQNKKLSHIFDVKDLLTIDKKIELLTFELTRYKAVWRSKVPMMAAFEQLSEIADVPTIAEVILAVYGDGDVQVHNDMSSVFLSVTGSFETFLQKNGANSNARLALAVLYYYHFKTAFKETADKNLKEMETTMHVMESAKREENIEPVPKDANDECDIVSAYSSLRLTKFMEILKSLNSCEDQISAIMNDTFEPDIIKSISRLLAKIGFEYRLHCFAIKSLRAFDMSMKCAQKISDNEGQLFALSFLVESADVKKNFIKELIDKGDELVKVLEGHNEKERYNKTIATYYVSKAKAYLHDDSKCSYEAWQKADALCTANEDKDEYQVLRAELYIILYKLTKNCDFIEGEHTREPMTLKLHMAFDIVIEMVQKNILTSYELCVLFDTVYELTKTYNLMRLPRDLRAYSKHSVLLTQKIVLPMRCVSFLILLAHSDLDTCKFDHCTVKLNGIDDIFCLSQSRPLLVPTEPFSVGDDSKGLEKDIDRCTDLIQELVLDLPKHTRQYSPASPTLALEGFKYPDFVRHKSSCMCFMCMSLEFQRLLLEKYNLNALLNMYEKDDKVAEEFVVGALTLYQTLSRNYDGYKDKVSTILPYALIANFDDIFLEAYATILFNYSYHMRRKSLKSEALQINIKLVQALRPQKLKYVYLYHDALLQRLAYIVSNSQEECAADNEMESRVENMHVNPSQDFLKTPLHQRTAVTVQVNGIPTFSAPKRKGKQCNLFGVTSDSAKKTPKITKSHEEFAVPKLKGKKAAVATPSTPFFGTVGTPNVQIFMDDGPLNSCVKTYSRKRTASIKKQPPIEIAAQEDTDSSSSLKVPNQLPVMSGSLKKTRGELLLTQKTKESSEESSSSYKRATRARRNLGVELLSEKVAIPNKGKTKAGPATKSDNDVDSSSSMIAVSPEHELAAAKTKVLLEKLKRSSKKREAQLNKAEKPKIASSSTELKKNLFGVFEDSSSSSGSSKSTKSTGAIRKSTRNRVL